MESTQHTGVTLPKDVIRNLIASEQFQNTGDILGCLKGMFKQVLQEVLSPLLGALYPAVLARAIPAISAPFPPALAL